MSAELREWRKRLRAELVGRRMALAPAQLEHHRLLMDGHLRAGFPNLSRGTLALCWPYKNEYDARYLARELRERGARTALPVVVAPKTPLIFREWYPGVQLAAGVYDIPYPVDSELLEPDWVLLPMNGFDLQGYRLGYGGGFFDRTLAAATKKPVVIGVTYELAKIETIQPQPFDIPMDYVVTEAGLYRRDGERLEFLGAPRAGDSASPVCDAT